MAYEIAGFSMRTRKWSIKPNWESRFLSVELVEYASVDSSSSFVFLIQTPFFSPSKTLSDI
ncbi:hypothetical protein Leryth_016496 [Lithospermum erythrorhizon]|nr:hypothetical protein Leryth_016496 [Lithospermum erythrorhizon]